jgi:flavin reductase (DIM6/NTAB) family NADH-FMN oxidoreductase RutF
MGKRCVDIKMFWYSDILVMPKFVTIITTVNNKGVVNAAPYSLGSPFDAGSENPQIMILMRSTSHTLKNITETGDFVINFPSWDQLDAVMETARFWPEGENELEHTTLTTVASMRVQPPSIQECRQHIECSLCKTIELGAVQSVVIGNIQAIVVDEHIPDMDRSNRITTLDPPIYLGDDRRRSFYFGRVGETQLRELKRPEKGHQALITTSIPWEPKALEKFSEVPEFMKETVVEVMESEARKAGLKIITSEFYTAIESLYAPKDIQERFD